MPLIGRQRDPKRVPFEVRLSPHVRVPGAGSAARGDMESGRRVGDDMLDVRDWVWGDASEARIRTTAKEASSGVRGHRWAPDAHWAIRKARVMGVRVPV